MHNITLKTLPSATLQQVFEQAAIHLLTQNKASKKYIDNTSGSICQYLNLEGLKCAAGCFISEEEYSSDFEGKSWYYLVELEKVPNTHVKFILELQRIHDTRDVTVWKEELKTLARRFKLRYSFLKKF